MKKPTWAVAVGIIGIVFGCFGVLGSGQTIMMPAIMEMQKGMFSTMQEAVEKDMEKNREATEKEKGGEEAEKGDGEQTGGAGEGTAKEPSASGGKDTACGYPPADMFGFMDKFWNFPPWYKTWCIAAGITGLVISGFYILSSVFLLLIRKSAIKMFYWAAGISICLSVAKAAVSMTANPLLGISMMFGSVVNIVISAVLLIVVATSNKAAFEYGFHDE